LSFEIFGGNTEEKNKKGFRASYPEALLLAGG
jgi:hypothetical protein